ncbi:uncharacterized protein BYT42DRAFT_181187 [Radiomyces spectabilis]|uniref:uncharacterized protein n=1 Tax=Radiomyces spectabilis TaxID=64574 RepID=UPI00221EEA23|nr:uncharacterized protein BYT42DRAFT_181187 [Radiomyces spectabilis]KAI8391075.1 hypothetical protein BYT42DRAFT_181187 [Radiomyces spectabilis]
MQPFPFRFLHHFSLFLSSLNCKHSASAIMSHIISSFTHVIAQRYPALFRHRWIAVVSVISALSVLQRIYSTLRVPKQLRHLPKVSTFGWFLSVFRGDPADIRLTQWVMPTVEQHGICLKYYLGRWTVTVGDPLLLQAMLKNVNAFPKEDKARLDPDLLLTNRESNMGNANYDVWKRQRRVANPAFHRAMPVHVFGEITLRMFQAIDKQHSDGVIDAADYMRR